ncbi:MAG: FG-GAP repeat domain-containing protein [Oscillospiraceae bacterium]
MKRAAEKVILAAMLLTLLFTATGCLFASPVSELYALPQMPEQYQDLEEQINALIAAGAEYAAPISGSNLQPVQMVDLDGDGTEEALIFMRKSAEEKPLKIYIFRMRGSGYRQAAVLEGSGTSIYSISYADLTGNGVQEILVGWRAGAETPALTVYGLRGDKPVLLLSTTYARYVLDEGGHGLVLLRSGPEERCVAECYRVAQSGALEVSSSVQLSSTVAELTGGRVVSGYLKGGVPALFAVGVSADGSTAMTDVLRWEDDGDLVNLTVNATTGYTTENAPWRELFPTDIDNDGVTELPVPEEAEPPEGGAGVIVEWRQFDGQGLSQTVARTYHDRSDGWYLLLPEEWWGQVEVYRSEASMYETSAMFFWNSGDTRTEFLRIYTFTGENRELRASRGNRFRLRTQQHTVYAGELLETAPEGLSLNEDRVRSLFSLIVTEWVSGEN